MTHSSPSGSVSDRPAAPTGSASWDPTSYLRYAGERGRPFVELLARVDATTPAQVVDLGCGPGNLTALLARRWPQAQVLGLDSAEPMIAAARRDHGDLVRFELGDLRDWARAAGAVSTADGRTEGPAAGPVDVLVSNAALQWLPDHLDLLPALVTAVRPGGWLAIQVPGNFAEPSHTIRRELATEPRFAAYLKGVAVPQSHDPAIYLQRLAGLGCTVDVWETTYLHVLTGADPVYEWVAGTGARPTIQALPDGPVRAAFVAEFQQRLRAAYPSGAAGVVLPFRRIFAVARRAA